MSLLAALKLPAVPSAAPPAQPEDGVRGRDAAAFEQASKLRDGMKDQLEKGWREAVEIAKKLDPGAKEGFVVQLQAIDKKRQEARRLDGDPPGQVVSLAAALMGLKQARQAVGKPVSDGTDANTAYKSADGTEVGKPTASVASSAGISTQNDGKNQSSLRTLVSDPLKNPGQTGTKGQNAAILEQKPKSTDEIPGTGQGKNQAIGKAEYDKAEELVKKGWNWINKQGETKIIIKNRTSKVMSFVKETDVLDKPGQSKWSRKAAPEIAAGGEDNMVVKTDMTIRGVTRANTSGSVVYEIAGKDEKARTAKVRLAWTRKGDKGMDMKDDWQTDTLAFEVKAQQTADGEFTFFVSEKKAADAKAKDPQDADDAKGKEPPPPDIFVLFDVGKSVLKSEAKSKLHEYAMAYLASKSAAKIHCEGYASIEGKDADNTESLLRKGGGGLHVSHRSQNRELAPGQSRFPWQRNHQGLRPCRP